MKWGEREKLYGIAVKAACLSYSCSKFGREAEYIVALYLKSIGWKDIRLSPGSRGPADIIASCPGNKWFIQLKASRGVPRLRGREIRELKELAENNEGLAVVSTLQPGGTGSFRIGYYAITFYELDNWKILDPIGSLGSKAVAALKPKARFH